MKILLVAGTRPNFMKIAPVLRAINAYNTSVKTNRIEPFLVHTGQHYDYEMSKVFFEDLGLPTPDASLEVGSGTHAQQTAEVMVRIEKLLLEKHPDMVFVVGDVNSTLAAAIAAVKLHIPIAHVESGVRTFDMTMPEEVNRVLTDHVSDYLFTTSEFDDKNLVKEGIPKAKIFCVGNVMIDSLLYMKQRAMQTDILDRLKLKPREYVLMTLHRPANVDNQENLNRILTYISEICRRIPVVFPVHPRTQKNIKDFGLGHVADSAEGRLILSEPLGYLNFLNLEMNARMVISDSGGVQVETTAFGVPCLTLMDIQVWVVTHKMGTNTLVGGDGHNLIKEANKVLDGKGKKGAAPALWDGKAAERIVKILAGLEVISKKPV